MRCSKCAGPHDYRQHDRYCETCKKGKGHLCVPNCFNCHGAHFANSKDCIFYLNRSSKERQVQLRDEFSQKWKEEAAALKAAANTDSGRAARTTAAIELQKKNNKGKTTAKASAKHSTKDDDDYVPVGKGGKAKYSFGGMAQALASTTRIDNVVDDKDDNNSNASSDLRLSYLDDIPLKQRFPSHKTPAPVKTNTASAPLPSLQKPLTITLPATGGSKPLRSVTDILRELKNPTTTSSETPGQTRFGGAEVAYSASALETEASEFAAALATSNIPSQPSPPTTVPPIPHISHDSDASATAAISQTPANQHD
ncbi:hypothetical protein AX14_010039 [Amanita brunnescens Koide BX004]|nr:hypothetical protein AX14_010039 [Amanita brunnescens Koide BX004]